VIRLADAWARLDGGLLVEVDGDGITAVPTWVPPLAEPTTASAEG
jgi:hypothetical protein